MIWDVTKIHYDIRDLGKDVKTIFPTEMNTEANSPVNVEFWTMLNIVVTGGIHNLPNYSSDDNQYDYSDDNLPTYSDDNLAFSDDNLPDYSSDFSQYD